MDFNLIHKAIEQMIQSILESLYEGKKISYNQSYYLFENIIQRKLTKEQIASVIISMKVRGETSEEIAGAAKVMLNHMKYFPRPKYLFADIVGTGGDYKDSINISTTSAIVAAGCGVKIAKHNNRSISSISGSSNLLELFGINLLMSAKQSRKSLDKLGICFLFAPKYNDGFNNDIIKVRSILKTRTLFNILGPLLNPARPKLALIGVYSNKLLYPIAQTLKMLKYKRAIVIHSGGMDEVSLHAKTQVVELKNKEIKSYSLNAEDFGLQYQSSNSLTIRTAEENYEIILNLLKGKGNFIHESVIAANVALLLKLFGKENLRKNTCLALDEIRSGKSYTRIMSLARQG